MLKAGIKNTISDIVTDQKSAKNIKSGGLSVYATPMMIALIENCCFSSVENELSDNESTVGTEMNISHLSPSPVGIKVFCESELIEINNRELVFSVIVSDEKTIIGKGIHKRFIINKDKFINKAIQKLNNKA